MATSTTLKALRRRVMQELGERVAGFFHDSIDSITTTSITVADVFRGLDESALSGQESILFRPEANSSIDFYRRAGQLTPSTGAVTINGEDYTDVTETNESLEVWHHGVRADKDVHPAINRALEFIDSDTFMAISHVGDLDGDMFKSTDTDWTNVGTPTTSAKSTTARRTPYGVRSYQLINDAANEGTQSATLPTDAATSGHSVKAFTVSSVNVGEASFRFYDVTNSADFDTAAVTHSEEEPQLMVQEWQEAPDDCKEMALRLLGTTSTSDVFWNQLWVYKQGVYRINLPSYISERHKAPVIYEMRPRSNTASNVYNAASVEFIPLTANVDYFYLTGHNDANPHAIMMREGWDYQWPLVVMARLPYSEMGAMTDDDATTNAPLHLLTPLIRRELLNAVYQYKVPDQQFRRLIAATLDDIKKGQAARTPTRPGPKRPFFQGIGRGV